jgi:hypothetical protein
MTPPWRNLLLSQLFLVAVILNLCAAVKRNDFSALTIETILATLLMYLGQLVTVPGGARAAKMAPLFTLAGAMLLLSTALCRGFDVAAPAAILAPLGVSLIAGFGFAWLRRRAS